MTENLLYKLEEKMMVMLGELEDLRKEQQHLSQENAALKIELDKSKVNQETYAKKLQDLISLLDTINVTEQPAPATANVMAAKPMLVQG